MSEQTVSIPTGDGDLTAFLAAPDEAAARGRGVLVLHELFGLNDDIRRIARRFADNGYVALAPDLYSVGPRAKPICIRRTMQALRSGEGRAFDDIEAARSWLAARDDVDDSQVAIAGFCMGAALPFSTRRGRRSVLPPTYTERFLGNRKRSKASVPCSPDTVSGIASSSVRLIGCAGIWTSSGLNMK